MTEPKPAAYWIRPQIQALTAYYVPDPGHMIKLDAMENPYGWPDNLVDEWLQVLRGVELNRYPDPAARRLTQSLRDTWNVPATMQVVLGNGSDELIQMLMLAVAAQGRCILSVDPTFVMYRMIAEVTGLGYHSVPLAADFSLDESAMLAAIRKHQPAIVFLAYPNNPTGGLFDQGLVEAIVRDAPGLVVIDEAYAPFTDASFMSRLGEFPNLLVLRTVSKMGLAGLRLGLLAGPREWLGEIDKTRLPYNINILTQVSGLFALQHREVLDEQAASIRADRVRLQDALAKIPGLQVFPSEANFILFRTPAGRAGPVFSSLQEQGVLIKNLDPAGGRLQDCLRVTVGRRDENQAFLEALQSALSA
jgi:histidinol-phosphate aminotransferase